MLICSNHLLTTYLWCSLFNMFCFNPFTVKGVSCTQTRRLHDFIFHYHIPTNTLRVLSPLPHYLTRYALFLVPFYSPSINLFTSISSSLFTFSPHKRALCFSHLLELHVYLRIRIPHLPLCTIPSTALRSEYPFKFQKWDFQQKCQTKPKVWPIQIKALDEYILMELLVLLLKRSHFLAILFLDRGIYQWNRLHWYNIILHVNYISF